MPEVLQSPKSCKIRQFEGPALMRTNWIVRRSFCISPCIRLCTHAESEICKLKYKSCICRIHSVAARCPYRLTCKQILQRSIPAKSAFSKKVAAQCILATVAFGLFVLSASDSPGNQIPANLLSPKNNQTSNSTYCVLPNSLQGHYPPLLQ